MLKNYATTYGIQVSLPCWEELSAGFCPVEHLLNMYIISIQSYYPLISYMFPNFFPFFSDAQDYV
jgi:hypothetical protein